jgi:hypothetical protein
LENTEPDILSYLLTNKYFRDRVLDGDTEPNGSLEEWFRKHPDAAPDIKKASAYIKSFIFEENRLLPGELDELLDCIYKNE